jgi:transposase-like protein
MARQFEPEVILIAVGWYLRFSPSRDVEELLAERGLGFRSIATRLKKYSCLNE